MPQVVIEIWQGVFQAVYADTDHLCVVVVDRDSQEKAPLQCQAVTPGQWTDLPEDIRTALSLPTPTPLMEEGDDHS